MLGDGATPTLLQVFASDLAPARSMALRLLNTFGDARALEPLARALRDEGTGWPVREALGPLVKIDARFAADACLESLAASPATHPPHDPNTYVTDPRIGALVALGDMRVMPLLRAMTPDEAPPDAAAAGAVAMVYRAQLGDVSVVPRLIDLHMRVPAASTWGAERARERVMAALIATLDERVMPLIIAEFDGSSRHPEEGDHPVRASAAAYRYGTAIVPPMLEAITPGDVVNVGSIAQFLSDLHWGTRPEGPPNTPPSPEHVDMYASALMDSRYAIEPYRPYSADARLRSTLAQALASLGAEGKERLRRAAHTRTAHHEALTALASYSDEETAHQLGALATDVSYPYREAAAERLADMAWLHEDGAEPYWLTLLDDETIDAESACMRQIWLAGPSNGGTLLARMLESDDPPLREQARRAHRRYAESVRERPLAGLRIRVAAHREAYGYEDDITLRVEYINAGDRPMQVDTTRFDTPLYGLDDFNLEIVTPGGEVRTYPADSGHGSHGTAQAEGQPRTLQPGDRVATERNLGARCRRPGTCRVQVSRGLLPGSSGWRYTSPSPAPLLKSNAVEFRLEAPPRAFVDGLIAQLHVGLLTDESHKSIPDICRTLGALRDPRALDALRALALVPSRAFAVRNVEAISGSAQKALAEFHTTDLVPMWIQLLDRPHANAARQLGKLGDRRAIQPLRIRAYRFPLSGAYDMEAAAALGRLGDDGAIHAVRRDILATMDPEDEATWFPAVEVFSLLRPGETTVDLLNHRRPGVRAAAVYIANREGYVNVLAIAAADADARVRRRAVDALAARRGVRDDEPDEPALRAGALRRALDDSEPGIRRAAAIGLAWAGDDAGESLLREDLCDQDYAMRVRARGALAALRRSR